MGGVMLALFFGLTLFVIGEAIGYAIGAGGLPGGN
jgi:hypothetical protein